MRISPDAVTGIALVLHELATNAAKYGAFSRDTGTVDVTWAVGEGHLSIEWRERGGPEPQTPRKAGFGTVLTCRAVESQFGGTITYDWAKDGLCVAIALPLAAVLAFAKV